MDSKIKSIVRIIRYAKPDVILTHPENDYCSNHVELSKLVFRASFFATVPHYFPVPGSATKLTPIYYTDTDGGLKTEYVDISDVMDIKEAMLRCHESQLKWLSAHDNIDACKELRIHAASRGLQCGIAYAEGFTLLIASGRMKPYRMLP